MVFIYDFDLKYIYVPEGMLVLNVQDLLNDIRLAEESVIGITYPQIASASGKEDLGGGTYVGITLNLIGWQLKFPDSPGEQTTVKIHGGNLVGGVAGDTIAYSDGVQVLIVQSAASTIVVTGEGLNAAQAALLASAASDSQAAKEQATLARKVQTNKAIISNGGLIVSIYDDDGSTLLYVFDVTSDKLQRLPR